MKKYILLSIFCIPVMAWAQSDSIPLFLGKTCQRETFCTDAITCGVLPFKLTCEAKSRSKKLPFLTHSYQVDWDSDGKIDLKGASASVNLSSTNGLKTGKHKIIWRVTDVDNRSSFCEKDFLVASCEMPMVKSSIVPQNLFEIPSCLFYLTPSKFQIKFSNNCIDTSGLEFKLAGEGQYDDDLNRDEIFALGNQIIRQEGQQGTELFRIYIINQLGWITYFDQYAIIGPIFPDYNCGTTEGRNWIIFSGKLMNESGELLRNVRVRVNGRREWKTNSTGSYYLSFLRKKSLIDFYNNDNYHSGVTTADLVALQKIIIDAPLGTSPYKRIAGDVNGDKKVTTADLVELRKVVLYLQDTFSKNTSWKYIDATFKFESDRPEAENYPTSFQRDTGGYFVRDFIGLKVGDVNGSAKVNGLQESADRSSPTMSYLLSNQTVFANQPFTLRLPISELFQKDGFQFAIKIDPARATCLSVHGIDADSYSFDPLTGELLVSYVNGLSTGKDMSLQILPNVNGRLQDFLTFPTDKLVPEFYFNGEETRFAFGFDQVEAARFAAFPNPFSSTTTLKLFATKAEMIEYKLYEASGRLVWSRMFPAVAGWNEVPIDGNELPGGGTYYIQAKMEQGVLIEKLLAIIK